MGESGGTPATLEHGYAMWPADARPARLGADAAQATLRAAARTSGEAQARLFEEAVTSALSDLRSPEPSRRAAARLAVAGGIDGLRRHAESSAEIEGTPTGDAITDFTTALGRATQMRDRGDLDGAREQLSGALLLGTRIDSARPSSFSFAAQADAALRMHDQVWAPAHAVARDLPGRGRGTVSGAGLDGR